MANHAVMTIDGKKSPLKYLNYRFHRQTEDNGKPSTFFRKAEITVTKDSVYDKGSATTWMAEAKKAKDGEIVIYQDESEDTPLKTIKWTKGFIINYDETFNLELGNSNTLETFTISAEIIEIDSAKFDFKWPESHA